MLSEKAFKAPKNKFRVIGVDTFDMDDSDWIEGDFKTKKEALDYAKERGGTMLKMHVYDDCGNHIGEGGSF